MAGLLVLGTGVALAAAVMVLSAASSATAQNPAQADRADRRVRQTDHFEISYAPSLDLHAERVASEAERAYEHVSGDLRHNLGFKVPLVLFESAADLQRSRQTGAANAPLRAGDRSDRILFPVDVPADQWLGLLTHEVAHVFGFDILPGSTTPAWIAEGLAEYERNAWDPNDLVLLREAVRANAIPRITSFQADSPKSGSWKHSAMRPSISSSHVGARPACASSCSRSGNRRAAAETRTTRRFACRPRNSIARSRATCARDCPRAASPPRRGSSTPGPTVQVEGVITAIGVPAARHLACIELIVTAASGIEQRWGIECGDARAEDVVSALKPGQQVVITGTPTGARDVHRLVISSLVRRSDGFVWRARRLIVTTSAGFAAALPQNR